MIYAKFISCVAIKIFVIVKEFKIVKTFSIKDKIKSL